MALVLAALLTACGGTTGFPPVITAVKPQSVSYGRTATIYLGGKDLRSSLVVETNGGCVNPSFASNSTTDVLVLNCGVKVVGDMPLTIKTATGEVVYTTTITVPKPQVTLITSKGAITLELDPTIALHAVVPADASSDQLRRLHSVPGLKWQSLLLSKWDDQPNPWPLIGFLCAHPMPISGMSTSDKAQDGLLSQGMGELVRWAVDKLQNTLEPTAATGMPAPSKTAC